ncbi:MAG TPA: (d)CMP kinase [Chitinivibrionales bacterium]|jgi:cytidylate kinase|nr:(d)CMP kinase [Chitinivibrionales bacterium]
MPHPEKYLVIAIDGPAGSGKSSTAKLVAQRLGILHLDTGAMYRAVTLKCLRRGIPHRDHAAIAGLVKNIDISFTGAPAAMRVLMDGEDVTSAIRGDEVTKNVSDYCTVPAVRAVLVDLQRKIGSRKSLVCEGRDIGTVVFPDASLKFFLVAADEERARRRQKDFAAMGIKKSLDELVDEIRTRDHKDSSRENSPLCKADDAIELDTTNLTLDEQVRFIIEKAKKLL